MGTGEGAEGAAARAAAAKRWLEGRAAKIKSKGVVGSKVWQDGPFDALCMGNLVVSRAEGGRALCTFRVPAYLADIDGNWQPGAIATVIDDVGAAAIMTTEGIIKVSVDFDISFFSPAKIQEEVEIDARVVGHKGRLSAVAVEIRKRGSGEMVAQGRQWMTGSRVSRPISKM